MTCPASVPSQNPPKVVLLSGELFFTILSSGCDGGENGGTG